ncbi:Mdm33 family-domain-containing protein [Jimgerdemannia flammicorona]|uniref:Mdm33 family-domain-containing protein n=2 Tax=Jimgerdemannia flammicorona TaxID=994334 RepID=A0A433D2G3_9FUNG|nr:Mdm33 family-domain-containing protein [Jimgerdemannia flammicorona]RUS27893.1 Mdm33 family-domain-containing protein [Jimgerdemannia flammicorona]
MLRLAIARTLSRPHLVRPLAPTRPLTGPCRPLSSNVSAGGGETKKLDPLVGVETRRNPSARSALSPMLDRLQFTSDSLRGLTADVKDPQELLQKLAKALNEFTGYTQIEKVKEEVVKRAEAFDLSRQRLQTAKQHYESTIETRSRTQREINELLQRKHLWTSEDVTRFTELYRSEHTCSQGESLAKEEYQQREKEMDREYLELTRSIMERYHEEQLWSDKIRGASTYGTWALLAANVVLFVTLQTVFEPWKRRRMAERFEEMLVRKVEEEEEKFGGAIESLGRREEDLARSQMALVAALEVVGRWREGGVVGGEERDRERESGGLNEGEEELKVPVVVMPEEDGSIKMTRRGYLLYGVESAIAGGLVTALVAYFTKLPTRKI